MQRVIVHRMQPATPLMLAAVEAVAAGFPSPAQDYCDGPIDLTEMLIDDQAETYLVCAAGDSMNGAGISSGDEILVDRSKHPRDGEVVVAILDGVVVASSREAKALGLDLGTSWFDCARARPRSASRRTAPTTSCTASSYEAEAAICRNECALTEA